MFHVKRNKAWWARLSPIERAELCRLERESSKAYFYFRPGDVAKCGFCGAETDSPTYLCRRCQERLDALIAKADGDILSHSQDAF